MYAIVETGGKQYRVEEGDILRVELLEAEPASTVAFERVLGVAKDGQFQAGTPVVAGARVHATVLEHGRGKKIIVFKYKPKANYRRKTGHRQGFTKVRIDRIEA